MKDNKYVQFSKRIVIAVTICVTLLCLIAVILCWNGNDLVSLTNVVKVYIEYAMIVFVAYSGNSAVQKWIINKGPTISIGQTINDKTDEQQEQDSNG